MWTWFGLFGAWNIIWGVGFQIIFAYGLVFYVESHFYFSYVVYVFKFYVFSLMINEMRSKLNLFIEVKIWIFFHCLHVIFMPCNFSASWWYKLNVLKALNIKWCSPHYVCIMWKEMIEIINEPKKERCITFLNVFPMFWNFWLQNYFDMCFDNLVTCITSLLYSACFMISTHLYLYKNVFNDMSIHLSKEKKITKHLQPTYLWNYLTKMKQKIKSFEM
jgi:hypothetical protein